MNSYLLLRFFANPKFGALTEDTQDWLLFISNIPLGGLPTVKLFIDNCDAKLIPLGDTKLVPLGGLIVESIHHCFLVAFE